MISMRLTTYAMLVFAACLVGYFLGYQSGLTNLWSVTQGHITVDTLLTQISQSITSIGALNAVIGGSAVVVLIGLSVLSGFGAMFIIPLIILMIVANWFVFPIGLFADPSCTVITSVAGACAYGTFNLPIFAFLNIITILTYIEFIRGSA